MIERLSQSMCTALISNKFLLTPSKISFHLPVTILAMTEVLNLKMNIQLPLFWSTLRQYPAPCNRLWRSVHRAIHFDWISAETTRTYVQNEIKIQENLSCSAKSCLAWSYSDKSFQCRNIAISHQEKIHDRTTDLELNKRFPFGQTWREFPVFSNIYNLAESCLSISFHEGNCCLELAMKQGFLFFVRFFKKKNKYFRVCRFMIVYIHLFIINL